MYTSHWKQGKVYERRDKRPVDDIYPTGDTFLRVSPDALLLRSDVVRSSQVQRPCVNRMLIVALLKPTEVVEKEPGFPDIN